MSEHSEAQQSRQKLLNWAEIFFVSIAVAIRVYFIYLPFKVYNYLVVPGGDAPNHYTMVKEVLSGHYDLVYPKLFHILIAKFSIITGMSIMDSFKAVTPLLIILPSIAVYIFARKQFGRLAGIISLAIMLWGGTNYALIAFGDGNYPNILAAGFFMPLALLYLLESLKKGRLWNYLLAALFFGLTILTHHLTTAFMLLVILVYTIALGIWNVYEKVAPNYKRIVLFLVALTVLATVMIYTTGLKTVFVGAVQSVFASGTAHSELSLAPPLPYDDYAGQVGQLAWYGGLFSLFYLIYLMGKKEEGKHRAAYLLIFVWFGVLFIMSRMQLFGLPGRFARELAFPLVLSLGVVVAAMLNRLPKYSRIFAVGLFGFIILINLTQINSGLYKAPEFFNRMVWFTSSDKEVSDYLRTSTDPADKIVANPTTPYLPIFSQRNIEFLTPAYSANQSVLGTFLAQTSPKYIFIGKKTAANPDEKPYPFFIDFDKSTNALNLYVKTNKLAVFKKFTDGSVLYVFKPVLKKPNLL